MQVSTVTMITTTVVTMIAIPNSRILISNDNLNVKKLKKKKNTKHKKKKHKTIATLIGIIPLLERGESDLRDRI